MQSLQPICCIAPKTSICGADDHLQNTNCTMTWISIQMMPFLQKLAILARSNCSALIVIEAHMTCTVKKQVQGIAATASQGQDCVILIDLQHLQDSHIAVFSTATHGPQCYINVNGRYPSSLRLLADSFNQPLSLGINVCHISSFALPRSCLHWSSSRSREAQASCCRNLKINTTVGSKGIHTCHNIQHN